MKSFQNYRDLFAWQKAMALVEAVYNCSTQLPKEETYGLRSQLTRAAVSVPSNIAEGRSRYGSREFLHFLSIARGSLAESETLVILCGKLGFFSENTVKQLLEQSGEVGKLLTTLVKSLRR